MEGNQPDWIDEAFLAKVLSGRDADEPAVSIVSFTCYPAVAPGNNFLGLVTRVQVSYRVRDSTTLKSLSLIVKSPVKKGIFHLLTEKLQWFEKEVAMYKNLMPKMKSILNYQFAPSCFMCPIKNVLVLKDLTQEGYRMCDKIKQLDYYHCQKVVVMIAKFHAASVACYQQDPIVLKNVSQELEFIDGGPVEEETKGFLKFTFKAVADFVNELEVSTEFSELIYGKVDTIWDSLVRISTPKTSGLNVLNHGDLWTNNILFKYSDSGEVEDVKLIDYQLLKFATPVMDLVSLFWTSAREDVRERMLGELCDIYRHTLNTTLESLGCPERLSEEELRRDLQDSTDWALMLICKLLPWMMYTPDDDFSVEEVSSDTLRSDVLDDRSTSILNGPNFRDLLPALTRQVLKWLSQLKSKQF